jgi:hypothetical protein
VKPANFNVTLLVDEEGVVRVLDSTADRIIVEADELGQILTALLKALVGPEGEDQRIDVNLN